MAESQNSTPEFRVRRCEDPNDSETIYTLVKQLAEYEREPESAKLTAADYRRDGFETNPPLFFAALAEERERNGEKWTAIGLLLCFWKYSTWEGRSMHVEDIFVIPERRRRGVGRALFKHAVEAARKADAARLELSTFFQPNTPFTVTSLTLIDTAPRHRRRTRLEHPRGRFLRQGRRS